MRASADLDVQMRAAAFERVRQLSETHDHLGANQLGQGFSFAGERIPLYNPQRGIKPQKMRFLLSIRTVFPKKGNKVWCDDQRDIHRQIFESDETVDYAFKGTILKTPIIDGFMRPSRTACQSSIFWALRPPGTRS